MLRFLSYNNILLYKFNKAGNDIHGVMMMIEFYYISLKRYVVDLMVIDGVCVVYRIINRLGEE